MEYIIKETAIALWYYVMLWGIPWIIISITISMGSFKYIIYLDKELSKDLDELYTSNGQMKESLFTNIANRYNKYCICYPFIRHRITTRSIKFRIFMWINSLWIWSVFGVVFLIVLAKSLGVD